ncbi:MAG TPA: hypothetical protein RMH85_30420 [Polyangiaceae bacterium LLY-WYZ-15_(1-7)]|nr:hypothetical protein [Myxococcales bacterium]MAT29320.1 hypothetical protein [Sandaracinus sp.]HJK95138.1 hypothetical protein [Polyangiaceae bacterium LLY-WYZ-15_(1-7)]MBJ72119.1 hypothetical protein [Sandaracinus sp.]HJL05427.1 hypothetical protein [Polyangiaceae bacterium LLY-WYZ-15_(1-7)]
MSRSRTSLRGLPPALLIPLLAALACGGGAPRPRELVDIYRPESERVRAGASSVIFVPGVMGSVLRHADDEQVVWGAVWDRDESDEELLRDLALPYDPQGPLASIEDELVPGGQLLLVELDIRIAAVRARGYPGVFEGIVQALGDAGAHDRRPRAISKEDLEEGRNPIIGFGYDWRHDLSAEARRLHEVVLAASRAREEATGTRRVDLVGHSMGSQLVRYYLRYGPTPLPEEGPLPPVTWEGARLVRRAILLGPPNRGEAQAVQVLAEGVSVNPMLPHYPAAMTASFVSGYQLLPRPGEGRVVYEDGEDVDFFDVALWERYGWGPFHPEQDENLQLLMPDAETREERVALVRRHMARYLAHGRRFQEALDRPAAPPPELGFHVAVGDTIDTNAVLEVNRETGELSWGESAPGDGTVTRTSGLAQLHQVPHAAPTVYPDSVHFVDATHIGMTADPDLINHMLYLLLQAPDPAGLPATAGGEVELRGEEVRGEEVEPVGSPGSPPTDADSEDAGEPGSGEAADATGGAAPPTSTAAAGS